MNLFRFYLFLVILFAHLNGSFKTKPRTSSSSSTTTSSTSSTTPAPAAYWTNNDAHPFSVGPEIYQIFQACKELGLLPILVLKDCAFNFKSLTVNGYIPAAAIFFELKGSTLENLSAHRLQELGFQLSPILQDKIFVNNAHFKEHEPHTSESRVDRVPPSTMLGKDADWFLFSTPTTEWVVLGSRNMTGVNSMGSNSMFATIRKKLMVFVPELLEFASDNKILKVIGSGMKFKKIEEYMNANYFNNFRKVIKQGVILLIVICLGELPVVKALLGAVTLVALALRLFSILKSFPFRQISWSRRTTYLITRLNALIFLSLNFPSVIYQFLTSDRSKLIDDLDRIKSYLNWRRTYPLLQQPGIKIILVLGSSRPRKWKSLTVNGLLLAGAIFLKVDSSSSLARLNCRELELLGIQLPETLKDSIEVNWRHFEEHRRKYNLEPESLGIWVPWSLKGIIQGKCVDVYYEGESIYERPDGMLKYNNISFSLATNVLRKIEDDCFEVEPSFEVNVTMSSPWIVLGCPNLLDLNCTKKISPKRINYFSNVGNRVDALMNIKKIIKLFNLDFSEISKALHDILAIVVARFIGNPSLILGTILVFLIQVFTFISV